jgi:peptidoglycan hydrolase-like amidase
MYSIKKIKKIIIPLLILGVFLVLPIIQKDNYEAQAASASQVYRFWSSANRSHFYTLSAEERDRVRNKYTTNQWRYEGSPFTAFSSNVANTKPIYRFWSPKYRAHFYTISANEKNTVIAKYSSQEWRYEGVNFYAYNRQVSNSVPVYRFWSSQNRAHFYTTSPGEKTCIINNYTSWEWRYEGVAFWVPRAGANLSTDEDSCGASNGPEITVGLWSYTRSSLQNDPFEIEANKNYVIKDNNNKTIATVSGGKKTKVTYTSNKNLKIYNSISAKYSYRTVYFEAADGRNSNLIFDVHKPSSSLDEYRGKIKLRYSSDSGLIWVINTLPLEHYVWGDGELAGTGDMDHNRVMTTSFRTYGYWKLLYSTKFASEGFKVNATPGNQLYKGYNWEENHPRVKAAAQDTRGRIVTYDDDVALTPYSSWTDGRTRSFKERWGSSSYPWCQSVKDPYGKHPYKSTSQLVAEGNHMVGLSANGSLNLAGDHGWSWTRILNYYFDDIEIKKIY